MRGTDVQREIDNMTTTGWRKRQISKYEDDDIQEYTRPWVGLTDEDELDWDGGDLKSLVKAIEAKLKEKNCG